MFLLYTLENTRKPMVFWCFQGILNGNTGQKRANVNKNIWNNDMKEKSLSSQPFIYDHIKAGNWI